MVAVLVANSSRWAFVTEAWGGLADHLYVHPSRRHSRSSTSSLTGVLFDCRIGEMESPCLLSTFGSSGEEGSGALGVAPILD